MQPPLHGQCAHRRHHRGPDELNVFVEKHLAEKTTAEWRELLKAADVPVFPVQTFESLLQDGHLEDIGFFGEEEVPPSAGWRRRRY